MIMHLPIKRDALPAFMNGYKLHKSYINSFEVECCNTILTWQGLTESIYIHWVLYDADILG